MGKRGPRPTPTNLRILHGARPVRINDDEPKPQQGWPECPDSASAEVKQIWDYALRQLITMGTATKADRDALLCYCEAVVVHRNASRDLEEKPDLLIPGATGGMVRNPVITIQRDAAAQVRQFAQEFGFTPSARSEIRTGAAAARGMNADRYLTG